MKNRGMKNPFSEKTRWLFVQDGYVKCFECGRNQAELHHILGRISNSPLNAIPLCRKCHNAGNIHSPEKEREYLNKTFRYLVEINYIMTKKDGEFGKTYLHLYD